MSEDNSTNKNIHNLSKEDATNLEKSLEEVVSSMIRQDGERSYVNESLKKLEEDYGISKKNLRQIAKARKDDSYKEKEQEMEEFETAYQTIYGEE